MNTQTINYRNDFEGNDYYKTTLKDFVKKLSSKNNDDYDFSMDLKSQIVDDKIKNYYEFTGDGNEISNIYFDIDIDKGINKTLFKDLNKNEKYKDIETKIKTFIIDKLNEMKNDNLNEMKFVDCRNHRKTYDDKYKFSYRLFCYTHKLEKYKIKNLVKYLNKTVLENKDVSKLLPFNNDKMLDESIYDKNRKMRCVNSCKKYEDYALELCNINDKIEYTIIQRHKFVSSVELFKTTIINLDETIKIYKNTNKNNKNEFDILGNSSRYKYDLTIKDVETLLNKLSKKWYLEYNPWLNVLTVIKNLYNTKFYNNKKLYDVWKAFNKKGYSKTLKLTLEEFENKNNTYFNNNKGEILNINYLVCMINKETKECMSFFKKYVPYDDKLIIPENFKIQNIKINNEKDITYMDMTYTDFVNNDTIINQGTTGTGKTTIVAKNMYVYKNKNKNVKFLSIIDIRKLGEQQIKTFDDEKLNLINYQDLNNSDDFKKQEMTVCCINSLHKFFDLIDPKEYIIYIDEINSFINNYIFNNTLNKTLQKTNRILMNIISNCKKLIVSDAHINNLTMQFLEKRKTTNGLYIKNPYKKYEGIEATKYNKEQDFINEINRKIKNDEYFLFGCDSKTVIENLYNNCIDIFKSKKDKFILITSENPMKITNASKQFYKKFVFYSPSVKTGVDFSINEKQEALLYMNGNTISSNDMFQQLTRTRNLKSVKYYSNCESNNLIFNDETETVKYYNDLIKYSNDLNDSEVKLQNLCVYNDDEETKICKNTYYKLYCQASYLKNIDNTNKGIHFKNILINEGFDVYERGNEKKLNSGMKQILKDKTDKINDENFNVYCEKSIQIEFYENQVKKMKTLNIPFDEDLKLWNDKIENEVMLKNSIYDGLKSRIEILNLYPNNYKKYQSIISKASNFDNLFNFRNLFLTNETLNNKVVDVYNTTENVKIINNKYSKVIALRKFEKDNNICPFDINFHNDNDTKVILNIDDKFYNHLKLLFRIDKKKEKPNNLKELNEHYIQFINHMVGSDLVFINNKRIQTNKKRTCHYSINNDKIKWLFECLFENNKNTKNLDINLLKTFNIEINN
jgi:hypothetical protein